VRAAKAVTNSRKPNIKRGMKILQKTSVVALGSALLELFAAFCATKSGV
jgi:hypothetical protein